MAASLREIIDADLTWKYSTTHGFAETVTGPSGAVVGIFSKPYYQAGDGSVIASSSQPELRTKDADAMEQGDTVTIRSVNYLVSEVMPNGFGETIHRLRLSAGGLPDTETGIDGGQPDSLYDDGLDGGGA
jgi:hypothetical protein